ncbi:GAF domain-containing protein [Nevskia soli]|uniref:GAF domain-containing protein n=1 Tax=Nevskia soli TaxID=418856 RepID=UPI001C5CA9B7|nr:GAF domain-containing protein [Nevskia soli]
MEVSAATSQTLDLDELLANVGQIVRKVLDVDLFAIMLYSERSRELTIRYAIGHREEIVRNLKVALGEGITGVAAERREPILVPDVRKDTRYLNSLDAVRSELAVPMIAREKLVGVIDVQSTREGAYAEYDRSMLRLIASRAAAAIDNARLYRRAERQYKTLRTLSRISHEFTSILELDELLSKIASRVHGLIPYDAFSILLVDEERKVLRHRMSLRYDQRVKIDEVPFGMGIVGAAAESRQPIRVDDVSTDKRYISSHPDMFSEAAIPLVVHDRVMGVMNLESDRPAFFTDDHMRTLNLLAPQIASSIENARLYRDIAERERHMQEDLRAARELQTVLLPATVPPIRGLKAAVGLRPAREISGDVYDFFQHSDGSTVIAFGDSSGKGAAAALYGAVLDGLLRTLAPRWRRPSQLLKALNDKLQERPVEGRYVTLLLLLWSPQTMQFTVGNAGNTIPMICRDGEIMKVHVEGVPLGLLPDREYDEIVFSAIPGDTIVLYSDGVSDHQSPKNREFGRARLENIVRKQCGIAPQDLINEIFADLDRYNMVRFDDQTVIVLKVKPQSRSKQKA